MWSFIWCGVVEVVQEQLWSITRRDGWDIGGERGYENGGDIVDCSHGTESKSDSLDNFGNFGGFVLWIDFESATDSKSDFFGVFILWIELHIGNDSNRQFIDEFDIFTTESTAICDSADGYDAAVDKAIDFSWNAA